MNDAELNQILKRVQPPPRSDDYWADFPERVIRQLNRPPARPTPKSRLRPRLAWAGAVGLACLLTGFALGHWWTRPRESLQMSLAIAGFDKADNPEFEVAFRNIGEKDTTLNCGIMLSNGKVTLATKIRLHLTDPEGRAQELLLFGGSPRIVGQANDYLVPLRSGSVYTLKLQLDDFKPSSGNDFRLNHLPGQYQVLAQFEGSGAGNISSAMPGIKPMDCWKGRLQSNVATFERDTKGKSISPAQR
jgi:hypothetical protein